MYQNDLKIPKLLILNKEKNNFFKIIFKIKKNAFTSPLSLDLRI
jgi:hypothetical protein